MRDDDSSIKKTFIESISLTAAMAAYCSFWFGAGWPSLLMGGAIGTVYAATRLSTRTGNFGSLVLGRLRVALDRRRVRRLTQRAKRSPRFALEARAGAASQGGVRIEVTLPEHVDRSLRLSVILGEERGQGTILEGDPDIVFALLEASFQPPRDAHADDLVMIHRGQLVFESTKLDDPEDLVHTSERLTALAAKLPADLSDPAAVLEQAIEHAFDDRGAHACFLRLLQRHPRSPAAERALERALSQTNPLLLLTASRIVGRRAAAPLIELAADDKRSDEMRLEAIERAQELLEPTDFAALLDRLARSNCTPKLLESVTRRLRTLRQGGGLAVVDAVEERGQLALAPGEVGGLSKSEP